MMCGAGAGLRRCPAVRSLGRSLGLAVVCALLAAACSSSSKPRAAATAPSTPGGACSFTPDSSPSGSRSPGLPPADPSRTSGTETATLTLSQGVVTFREDDAKTPCTAASFRFLAGKGFFDHTTCHRLTAQGIFVLQCGDPTGTGSGGPGYTIPDENLTGASYSAGTVAMANTGAPHTGGSQFFLVYADSSLPPQYTPFGTITGGLAVLQAIAKAGEDDSNGPGDGKPKQPVTITSFRVTAAT
jgi:peptidyl-prolyl cis-trans isomerase B (cyclophilin B)